MENHERQRASLFTRVAFRRTSGQVQTTPAGREQVEDQSRPGFLPPGPDGTNGAVHSASAHILQLPVGVVATGEGVRRLQGQSLQPQFLALGVHGPVPRFPAAHAENVHQVAPLTALNPHKLPVEDGGDQRVSARRSGLHGLHPVARREEHALTARESLVDSVHRHRVVGQTASLPDEALRMGPVHVAQVREHLAATGKQGDVQLVVVVVAAVDAAVLHGEHGLAPESATANPNKPQVVVSEAGPSRTLALCQQLLQPLMSVGRAVEKSVKASPAQTRIAQSRCQVEQGAIGVVPGQRRFGQ